MSAGEKNAYYCQSCGGYMVTLDVDDGVTPASMSCITEGCGERAWSMFYPPEPWPDYIPTEPQFEWYAPDVVELKRMKKKARQRGGVHLEIYEHVRRGGLMRRTVTR